MSEVLDSLELEFTILEFHEDFVISRVREGMIIEQKLVNDLILVCSDFYNGKNFVFISLREKNYNVDPTIYFNLENIPNLKGIAVASENTPALNMANFERNFSTVPFEVFLDLNEAEEWTQKILKNK